MGFGREAMSPVAWNQVVLKIQHAARNVNTQFFLALGRLYLRSPGSRGEVSIAVNAAHRRA